MQAKNKTRKLAVIQGTCTCLLCTVIPNASTCLNTGTQYGLSFLKGQPQKLTVQRCLLPRRSCPLACIIAHRHSVAFPFAGTSGTVALPTRDWSYCGCYIFIYMCKRCKYFSPVVGEVCFGYGRDLKYCACLSGPQTTRLKIGMVFAFYQWDSSSWYL